MELVSKTINRVVLKIKLKEIKILSFDEVWDIIREAYPSEDYKIEETKNDDDNIIVTLEKKVPYI